MTAHPERLEKMYTVRPETLDSLGTCWREPGCGLRWPSLFTAPFWMKVWYSHFAHVNTLSIVSVRQGELPIGIAPMLLSGEDACLIGSPDVCDYLDFIVAPGRGRDFFTVLIAHLRRVGVKRIRLEAVREDSIALSELVPLARETGLDIISEEDDISYEMELPESWEGFLGTLNAKQRHEVRRKLRCLEQSGVVGFRVLEKPDDVRGGVADFLRLFRSNRKDKAAFMTDAKAAFFQALVQAAAEENALRLCFLDIDSRPVSVALCFDYGAARLLYNSGYDSRLSFLNVGLLCKVFSIRDSIERGCRKYDFLKGAEIYKQRLGGRQVQLSRCTVTLDSRG